MYWSQTILFLKNQKQTFCEFFAKQEASVKIW